MSTARQRETRRSRKHTVLTPARLRRQLPKPPQRHQEMESQAGYSDVHVDVDADADAAQKRVAGRGEMCW